MISESINDWLSDVFLFDLPEHTKRKSEKWRDLLDTLEDGSVVFIDTATTVNMKELNKTLGVLTSVLKDEAKKCLIVTATRASLNRRLNPSQLAGLKEIEIRNLQKIEGWPDDISKHARRLKVETDGNPLMIESICKDEGLWERFKHKELILSRHAKPIAYLLKEMWDSLSEDNQQALSVTAMLSHHSNEWKFEWGRNECLAVYGPSWDDSFFELSGNVSSKNRSRTFIRCMS